MFLLLKFSGGDACIYETETPLHAKVFETERAAVVEGVTVDPKATDITRAESVDVGQKRPATDVAEPREGQRLKLDVEAAAEVLAPGSAVRMMDLQRTGAKPVPGEPADPVRTPKHESF